MAAKPRVKKARLPKQRFTVSWTSFPRDPDKIELTVFGPGVDGSALQLSRVAILVQTMLNASDKAFKPRAAKKPVALAVDNAK